MMVTRLPPCSLAVCFARTSNPYDALYLLVKIVFTALSGWFPVQWHVFVAADSRTYRELDCLLVLLAECASGENGISIRDRLECRRPIRANGREDIRHIACRLLDLGEELGRSTGSGFNSGVEIRDMMTLLHGLVAVQPTTSFTYVRDVFLLIRE
jgi:hypothetical protein